MGSAPASDSLAAMLEALLETLRGLYERWCFDERDEDRIQTAAESIKRAIEVLRSE